MPIEVNDQDGSRKLSVLEFIAYLDVDPTEAARHVLTHLIPGIPCTVGDAEFRLPSGVSGEDLIAEWNSHAGTSLPDRADEDKITVLFPITRDVAGQPRMSVTTAELNSHLIRYTDGAAQNRSHVGGLMLRYPPNLVWGALSELLGEGVSEASFTLPDNGRTIILQSAPAKQGLLGAQMVSWRSSYPALPEVPEPFNTKLHVR